MDNEETIGKALADFVMQSFRDEATVYSNFYNSLIAETKIDKILSESRKFAHLKKSRKLIIPNTHE